MKVIHLILLLCFLLGACQTEVKEQSKTEKESSNIPVVSPIKFQNKGHELVYKMVQKVGDYEKLKALKDVSFTYTFQTIDHKTDVSKEYYIFEQELSYGNYEKHERTFPALDGKIEQGFDGHSFWMKHKGVLLEAEEYLKPTEFRRKANFYWFTMMQKLLDSGLEYEYIKEEIIDRQPYDVVKVLFPLEEGKARGTYQLYLNQNTHLVDQFLYRVADVKVLDPRLMKIEYEEVDGIFIPSTRKNTKSNWDGVVFKEEWNSMFWTDIKFDNGLSKEIVAIKKGKN